MKLLKFENFQETVEILKQDIMQSHLMVCMCKASVRQNLYLIRSTWTILVDDLAEAVSDQHRPQTALRSDWP